MIVGRHINVVYTAQKNFTGECALSWWDGQRWQDKRLNISELRAEVDKLPEGVHWRVWEWRDED